MLNSAVALTNAMNSSTVFYGEKRENDLLKQQHSLRGTCVNQEMSNIYIF